ncbi:GHMP kinase [Eubacteriales bacterium OttesenSCG-928-N13]|nr:GHMP kinase [Eubacteriales bacterium OttesenSCG-928-N13]
MTDIQSIFAERFPSEKGEVRRVFSPYRVCPLGAHVDHQFGFVSGFAIDQGVELAYQPTGSDQIVLISEDFPGEVRFSVGERMPQRMDDWGDFARGCVWALGKQFPLTHGFRGVVRGALPIGGLSSSAAVILCYLQALIALHDLSISPEELIELALQAEKDYVGMSVGKLDQSCEVHSKQNHLLYLDTRDQQFELIETPENMPEFDFLVVYSGLSRKLGSGFNHRVDELKAASWYLKALAGMELGSFAESRLRDIPSELFWRHENQLPEPFRRRARHFYTECERVQKGAQLWREGDLAGFGQLVFESGRSSIENYETGSEHLIALYEALREATGVYGARFSGAGFKGCCIALIDPAYRDEITRFVSDRYLAQYPELKDVFSTHICHTADGVGVARA